MPICYVCESSLALPNGVLTEECNRSIEETIQQAEKVVDSEKSVYTMSPFFLQPLILFADEKGVLDNWKFVLLHDDGSEEDKTDKRQHLFEMMSSPLDRLFTTAWKDGQ